VKISHALSQFSSYKTKIFSCCFKEVKLQRMSVNCVSVLYMVIPPFFFFISSKILRCISSHHDTIWSPHYTFEYAADELRDEWRQSWIVIGVVVIFKTSLGHALICHCLAVNLLVSLVAPTFHLFTLFSDQDKTQSLTPIVNTIVNNNNC
jgi:hypothetical protein